jgi:hypothetical protein
MRKKEIFLINLKEVIFMSTKNDEVKILEEEVVKNEVETTELVVTEKEAKKAKMTATAKKGLKIAGLAAIGIVGFLIGRGSAAKAESNDSDIIDMEYEVVESDEE